MPATQIRSFPPLRSVMSSSSGSQQTSQPTSMPPIYSTPTQSPFGAGAPRYKAPGLFAAQKARGEIR